MFPRRRYERYRPMGSALVVFERPRMFNMGKPQIIKLGPLSDISRGGLSVEYVADRKPPGDHRELSILVPGHGVMVYRIPFRNISDTVVAEFGEKRIIKRRGFQFRELNDYHTEKLKKFINLYTGDEIPDRRSGFERRVVSRSGDSPAIIPNHRSRMQQDRRKQKMVD